MTKLNTWKFILESLSKNIEVILLYVLESTGSSPGRQGFFMAITSNNEISGSIGGGIMEHKFVELSKELLQKNGDANYIKKQIHNKEAASNQSGMICSGEQTFFSYKIKKKDQDIIQQLIEAIEQNDNTFLILQPNAILLSKENGGENYSFVYKNEKEWTYKEKLGLKNNLYIVGGGHCSLALSKLASSLDFCIHIIDDRESLNTIEQNIDAHNKIWVNNYSELNTIIPSGNNNYVVIMTIGYRTDAIAIKALLQNDYKYIGVLGSREKLKTLFAELKNGGIEQAKLDKIHAPIGLEINSQTPEEIAVSIAAEIIKVKNKRDL
ncbi:MAG: XdhC family protein [Chitinophagales bacterium]|nr:XdhC family protein [Chitinophagales bacterium]